MISMYERASLRAAPATANRRVLAWIASRGLWVALLWLHAHLLWQRIVDQTLFEPLVALRWIASALIAVTMIHFQRRGVSLFRGRRAKILWLVILLLHAGSATAVGRHLEIVAEGGLVIAVSLWLLALEETFSRRSADARLALRRSWVLQPAPVRLPFMAAALDPLCPRPPPLA